MPRRSRGANDRGCSSSSRGTSGRALPASPGRFRADSGTATDLALVPSHDHAFSEIISPILSTTYLSRHPAGPTTGSYTGGEETMAAISPASGSADCASATNSHQGASHDREPRRGGPINSPDDSAAREPRDTDPHQHLLSPATSGRLGSAAQPTLPPTRILLCRPMTHHHPAQRGPISASEQVRRRRQPPTCRGWVEPPIESGQEWPKAAKSGQPCQPTTAQVVRVSSERAMRTETNPIPPPPGIPPKPAIAPGPRSQNVGARHAVPACPVSATRRPRGKDRRTKFRRTCLGSVSSKQPSTRAPALPPRKNRRTQSRPPGFGGTL